MHTCTKPWLAHRYKDFAPEALISMVDPGGRGQIQSTDPPPQPSRLSAYDHETASVVVSYNTI